MRVQKKRTSGFEQWNRSDSRALSNNLIESMVSETQTIPELASVKQHELTVMRGSEAIHRARSLQDFTGTPSHPARDLNWLAVLQDGLSQVPYLIELREEGELAGYLPLAFVKSLLFGRYLIGLPYLNSGGVDELPALEASRLIDAAVELAEELNCRFLELRHEHAVSHPAFNAELTQKVHMRLQLPATEQQLWDQLKSKVRSQVKKGLSYEFPFEWGGESLLDEFYQLFSIRMHELGTPVYGKRLFQSILREFGERAEICCLRDSNRAIAAAMLIHGETITEVPSAASLMSYNRSNANMTLYWQLMSRAIQRGSLFFDFGRATRDSGTHRFKKQWGSEESPTCWQYHVREGSADALRPDNQKNQKRIEMWKKLPLWVTRLCGPAIVRGIP